MITETLQFNQQGATGGRTYGHDYVPYTNYACKYSHINNLAVIAKIFGMKPAPIMRASVLELGCGNGGNLIPMAYSLPGSVFWGVDTLAHTLADGQAMINDLGLKNIDLRHFNYMDIPDEIGTFDYIIANSIYSGLPVQQQEKILQICQKHLAPDGVAYINYSTYPGGHLRTMIRDMMLYHTEQIQEPAACVAQARALLNFLSQNVNALCQSVVGSTAKLGADQIKTDKINGLTAYEAVLRAELEMLNQNPDIFLFQEHLARHNQPLYFYQFIDQAKRHELQYLGEAEFGTMLTSNFPKDVESTLAHLSNDIIKTEQYMDFVRNRTFRQTLLCHQNVSLNRRLAQENVMNFYIASPARPVIEVKNDHIYSPVTFTHAGSVFTTAEPVVKAALLHLSQAWPRSVPFADLLRQACLNNVIPDDSSSAKQTLASNLLLAFGINLVDFRTEADLFVTEISNCPLASAMARYQARSSNQITNLMHESIEMDIFSLHLLDCLDGHCNRLEILNYMSKLIQDGILNVRKDGKQVIENELLKDILIRDIDDCLNKFASAAILTA